MELLALAVVGMLASTAQAGGTIARGVGNGGLTAHGDETLSRGVFESSEFSWHVAPRFELLGEALTLTGVHYAPDPASEQDTVAVLAAVRWTALRHGNHALYLQDGIGVAELIRE